MVAARARYFENAVQLNGQAVQIVPNSVVTVYEAGTLTPVSGAALFAGVTGGTTLGNPFTTDASGNILFYLDAPRRVKLVATGVGVGPVTADYEPVLPDPAEIATSGMPNPLRLDGYAGVADHALTVRPSSGGDTGNKGLLVQDNAGATILQAAALGGGGTYGADTFVYAPRVIIGNLRNGTTNSDLFVVHNRLTGAPTGSFVPMAVLMDTVTNPTDGFNGSANIPDELGISVVSKARNVASGASQNYDGSLRAVELQTLVFASCGLKRTYGAAEVGIHTALNQTSVIEDPVTPNNLYGSYGIYIHSASQVDPGYGTGTRANFGVLTGGSQGMKHPYAAFDVDGVTRLWSVDQNGKQVSGHIVPRAGSTYNLGSASAGDFWSAIYANFFVLATSGSAGGPALTWASDTTTGFFRVSAGVFAVTNAGTEAFRIASTGEIDWRRGQNVAAGGGATATLGTIGGSGPAGAGMAGWLRQKVNGTNVFSPYWL